MQKFPIFHTINTIKFEKRVGGGENFFQFRTVLVAGFLLPLRKTEATRYAATPKHTDDVELSMPLCAINHYPLTTKSMMQCSFGNNCVKYKKCLR